MLNGALYSSNAFVTKFNSAGTALLYSTYIGGGGNYGPIGSVSDGGAAIAVDSSGNAYITGYTYSPSFPVTENAFQKVNKGGVYSSEAYQTGGYAADNAFIAKLNPAGSALVYSSYLGGSGYFIDGDPTYNTQPMAYGDSASAIAIDPAGNAYVTGTASSTNFPVTPGAFQTAIAESTFFIATSACVFVAKINPLGSALIYSTYLGDQNSTGGAGIALDASGDAYVTGSTYSPYFPVTGDAFQKALYGVGNESAFITKFNPAGAALVYSTYLGGNGENYAHAIAVDAAGNAYVAGSTYALDFPTTPYAAQLVPGYPYGGTAFVTKMNPAGSALVYSTYLGGGGGDTAADFASGIAVDAYGNAYVTGTAQTSSFPVTSDAFQKVNHDPGVGNAFVTQLNPNGSALLYSTYIGGSGGGNGIGQRVGDNGTAIAVDAAGHSYIAGFAGSANFPLTTSAYDKYNRTSGCDLDVDCLGEPDGFVSIFHLNIIDFSGGFAQAAAPLGTMQFNGVAGLEGPHLALTLGSNYEAGSAFNSIPVNIQSFNTDFTFQLIDPNADGFTFTVQNIGPKALGAYGSALGYAPIGRSVAIKFDLHNNAGEGQDSTGIYVDGALPTVPALNLAGTGIDLHSGHIFDTYLLYDGTDLKLTITDTVTKATYSHSFPINIPATVGGNTAYVGFTGGTGFDTATQEILTWTFANP